MHPIDPERSLAAEEPLGRRFQQFRQLKALHWDSQYEGMQFVGQGGQGMVFHSRRIGVDGFRLPVALKAFSPLVYASVADYEADMRRMAEVAMRVARVQSPQLLEVHNFIEDQGIRVMVMEWVHGYDLRRLLQAQTLHVVRSKMSASNWAHLNDVVITEGADQSRLKPGIAIQILRETLTGLSLLHRAGVAHGDLKPSNLMVSLTGNVKLVDFGSAVDMHAEASRACRTPAYAAPEILAGGPKSAPSDLASVGYVLVEMLSGHRLFAHTASEETLIAEKRRLPERLPSLLPPDVARNSDLLALCQDLVHPDPEKRLRSAEEANLFRAAALHRQLVKTNLDSEYENDLRVLMEALPMEITLSETPPEASLSPSDALLAEAVTRRD